MAARYNVIHISKEKMAVLIPYLWLLLSVFAQLLGVCDLHHSLNVPMRVGMVYNISIKIWDFEVSIHSLILIKYFLSASYYQELF